MSLCALFASSFLAATVLPGGSEAVLFAVIKANVQLYWAALVVATIGNTLGGMTSYAIGRFVPQPERLKHAQRVERYGTPLLLFSCVPVVGDAFCVAAGWLRLNPLLAAVFMALGKFARCVAVAALAA